jgi:hypothetical protein
MNDATYASKSTEQSGIAHEARHGTRDECLHDDWRVVAYTDCAFAPTRFRPEGPPGDYAGAERMAESIEQHVPRLRRPIQAHRQYRDLGSSSSDNPGDGPVIRILCPWGLTGRCAGNYLQRRLV